MYLVTNSVGKYTVLINEYIAIKQVDKCQYLVIGLTRNGCEKYYLSITKQESYTLSKLDSVEPAHNDLKKENACESVLCHGTEMLILNVYTVEADYLKRKRTNT